MQPAGDAEGPAPVLGRAPLVLRLERALARLVPGFPAARCAVALSGGVDSVVLLHVLATLAAGRPLLGLRALHVHHGLQPAADEWVAACRAHCTQLGVPLEVIRLGLRPARGTSHEAEAREARYAALAGRLEAGECLLTAHHQDDQLETLLLQLLRGAGVPGLAAMPAVADLGAGLHARPLLDTARTELADYARAHGLSWVEDPMNTEQRYDRAYLRNRVLPALRERWPAAGATVGRAARHLAEAQRLLESLAALDAAPWLSDGCLETAGLLPLPRERQANVLRWWLSTQGLGAPSVPRLAAILDNVVPARVDATPVVTWPSGEVRRYRGRLYAMHPLGPAPAGEWPLIAAAPTTIAGSGEVALEPTDGPGLARDRVGLPLTIRFRRGGETLRVAGNPLSKPLQRWLQEAGVPPWLRGRIPLVYAGQELVAVGDRWVAASAAATPGEPAWKVRWSRAQT